MKHWCGKGLLQRDRERGRCGRCGTSIYMPPPNMTKAERKRLMASRGPEVPASIVHLLSICNACEHGKHKECEDDIHWFCTCYRARHDPKKLEVDGFKPGDDKAILKELGRRKGNVSADDEDEEEWESFG